MILFLIGDTPLLNGNDDRYYSALKELSKEYIPNIPTFRKFVYPTYLESLKKKDIQQYQQELIDFIHKHHIKIIVAFGEHAFTALEMENKKVTDIGFIPQTSPLLQNTFIDKRSKSTQFKNFEYIPNKGLFIGSKYVDKVKRVTTTKGKYETEEAIIDPSRGMFIENKRILHLTDKNPIIYPIFKQETFFSYRKSDRGMGVLKTAFERVAEIVKEGYTPFKYTDFKKEIRLYTDKSQLPLARENIARLKTKKAIALDIETAWDDIPKEAWLNFRHKDADIPVIAIGDNEGTEVFCTRFLPELWPDIEDLLSDEKKLVLTWNGKFDLSYLKYVKKINCKGIYIDGMICLYLKDTGLAQVGQKLGSLKKTTCRYLHVNYSGYQKTSGIDKAIKDGDGEYLVKNLDYYMGYCGLDVHVTYKVVKLLYNGLNKESKKLAKEYYPELWETLNDIHNSGIRVDTELLEQYISELTIFLKHFEKDICKKVESLQVQYNKRLTVQEFNPNSTKQIAELLFDIIGLPPNLTDKGNYSVNGEYLESQTEPICKMLTDFTGFSKQLSLLKTIHDHTKDGYCFPFYNWNATSSGRLSCKSPNLQQMPKYKIFYNIFKGKIYNIEDLLQRPLWHSYKTKYDESKNETTIIETSPTVKRIFIPRKGNIFIYSDYSQLEVFVLANYISTISKCTILQDALIEGKDIHSFTASIVESIKQNREVTYEEVYLNKEEQPYSSWRKDAKGVLFSIIYGKSAFVYHQQTGMPLEDAERLFDNFLVAIKGVNDFKIYSHAMAKVNLQTNTYQGIVRDLSILSINSKHKRAGNIALNHPIQGTACKIVNDALMKMAIEVKQYEGLIDLTVHDSMMIELPEVNLQTGIQLMKDVMIKYPSEIYPDFIKVPLAIDIEYGYTWHDLKKVG